MLNAICRLCQILSFAQKNSGEVMKNRNGLAAIEFWLQPDRKSLTLK